MMGLVALMTAMLISLNVQRASLSAQTKVIENEMETIAGGIALETLDFVGSKPFDAATAGGTVQEASELTPAPFTTNKLYTEAGDIDDFHEMQTHTLQEFDFDFSVDMTVEYVDENNPDLPSATQTFAKKVTVTINNPFLRNPVQIAHVYTYP